MKLEYNVATDTLHIDLTGTMAVEHREPTPGAIVGIGEHKEVANITVEGAAARVDFADLRIVGWPGQ